MIRLVFPGGTVAAEFNGGLVFSVKIAAAGDEQTIFHCDIHIVSRGFLIVIRGECFYSVNLPKRMLFSSSVSLRSGSDRDGPVRRCLRRHGSAIPHQPGIYSGQARKRVFLLRKKSQ